jgi:broad specificity phosphatase PhoE
VGVEVVYETHATSTDNEAGIATGWRGGELSATGRRQARELGGRRRGTGLEAVFTSDLTRAVVDRVSAFLTEIRLEFEGRRVLLIGHAATRWALDHLLDGADLETLLCAPFDWQEGWTYHLA